MNNYTATDYPICTAEYKIEGPRTETAKQVVENMGAILFEMNNTVEMMTSGLISPDAVKVQTNTREPKEESFIDTIRRQRDFAEEILKALCRIREALW